MRLCRQPVEELATGESGCLLVETEMRWYVPLPVRPCYETRGGKNAAKRRVAGKLFGGQYVIGDSGQGLANPAPRFVDDVKHLVRVYERSVGWRDDAVGLSKR